MAADGRQIIPYFDPVNVRVTEAWLMTAHTESDASGILRRAGSLEASLTAAGAATLGLRAGEQGWQVLAWAPSAATLPDGLAGATSELEDGVLLVGPANAENAAALRGLLPWLRPRAVGTAPSVAVGDRLGLATPGHLRAFRAHPGIAPVLAQQSERELGRTGRTIAEVVDAATFGALAAGWRDGYGADGDHLKSMEQLDASLDAGCSMVTADPIGVVPDLPADAPRPAIQAAFAQVPWAALEDDPAAFAARYPAALEVEGGHLPLPPEALVAAAARFGPALVQVLAMYRRLVARAGEGTVEFEVAVDEIEHPTTAVDHVYFATELRRLGVRPQAFAPRFVGEFEKGIDYRGDLRAFEADLATHAALARVLGPYKLSVHSGSDKFSVYPSVARETRGLVHLKTSGTSYLEALRTVAALEPELLRRVWRVALEAYATARASYHVSATVAGMPEPERLSAAELAGLLDRPDAREILHVTFGAVLGADPLRGELRSLLWTEREAYWDRLAVHIGRHLAPFEPEVDGRPRHRGEDNEE
jgi:hypothetical protein